MFSSPGTATYELESELLQLFVVLGNENFVGEKREPPNQLRPNLTLTLLADRFLTLWASHLCLETRSSHCIRTQVIRNLSGDAKTVHHSLTPYKSVAAHTYLVLDINSGSVVCGLWAAVEMSNTCGGNERGEAGGQDRPERLSTSITNWCKVGRKRLVEGNAEGRCALCAGTILR